jgi:hypothetical protein
MEGYAYKEYREDGSYTWILNDVILTDLLAIDNNNTVLFVDSTISTTSDKSLMTAIDGLWDVIKDYIRTKTGLVVITKETRQYKVFDFPEEAKEIDLSYFIVTPSTGL